MSVEKAGCAVEEAVNFSVFLSALVLAVLAFLIIFK